MKSSLTRSIGRSRVIDRSQKWGAKLRVLLAPGTGGKLQLRKSLEVLEECSIFLPLSFTASHDCLISPFSEHAHTRGGREIVDPHDPVWTIGPM